MAIIDFFDRGWRSNPNGIAYIQGDAQWSFEKTGRLSCQIANRLLAQGYSSGSKGAVWAGNDVKSWICTLGLWRANMAWIPVNARGSQEDNLHVLNSFDCDVLFYQAAFAEQIETVRALLPQIRLWVCIDDEQGSFETWLAGASDRVPSIETDLDDVVMLSPTGGTTGLPKGVMNTHRSTQTFVAHFMMACHYSADERPVNLAAAPMTHTAGLLSLPCTARGGTVVVLAKPDAGPMLGAIEEHGVTEFFLPPTVIYRLLDIPNIEKLNFSSLRYFMYGAAPMSVEKLKRAIEVFGPVMTGGYGQTEAPASISFLTPDEHFENRRLASDERLTSVGRPNPLVRVEIMDGENGILPVGESGEICVRGDLVMKGYYKAAEKTAETIIDGWLHTGDIGHLDADGYLHITDRKKDMIISGGFNVYPSEVEQVLWSHEAVQDCAVIGVPDEQWGEAVKAVVELNSGASVDEADLIALCKTKLGSVKAPKSVDFVPALPRSPVGKVLKKDLREQYWSAASRKI
ncbi:AMP-binding protein [Zhongshania sp.]|uniref:AMP-binding protein n=1 Tax=Zhongshania sp. TaxID=1971902 RepID=UPI003568C0D4